MSEKINPEEKNAANDIAQLIQLGRDQGFLTHADINDTLPEAQQTKIISQKFFKHLKIWGLKFLKRLLMKMS